MGTTEWGWEAGGGWGTGIEDILVEFWQERPLEGYCRKRCS